MGKPEWGHAHSSTPEHIGCKRITWGTETSKYPEEEKSTEIALVAASERARAQTRNGADRQGDAIRVLWESTL